ncbi:acyloxyacyl hydrolase-like [Physella acuta]|uniref:acyloxyacyl hydrolase-like n=1 Tax=Physella acuta TaxID=109671 RepID=UPI0027DDA194|nr:acyloxyacyl hydrolase-like [Physella acuta]
MKSIAGWVLPALLLFAAIPDSKQGANGGNNCLVCTYIVALLEQLTEIRQTSVIETLDQFCSYLPVDVQPMCHTAIKALGPAVIKLLIAREDPNVICHALKICYTEPGQPVCRGPAPPGSSGVKDPDFKAKVLAARLSLSPAIGQLSHLNVLTFCQIPGVRELCYWIHRFSDQHEPVKDDDQDGFSTMFGMRGTAWRGKDCSDQAPDIHPGAIPQNGDREVDSNCNGIFGVNNLTQQNYEDELCGSSQPRGVVVLGDSISAHFHLPRQWFDATLISKDSFKNLLTILENEFDWPSMSTMTGYGENLWPEAITGAVDSIYKRLRERNRCNHRDYQNLAANGVSSWKVMKAAKTLSRHAGKDQPLLVYFALAGNDVCTSRWNSVDDMTSPEEMYNNTMATLDLLGQTLPNNSHVILVSLLDGGVIYDIMATRVHPATTYWGTFTYGDLYQYYECLQMTLCVGWLNANKTIRDMTSKRAEQLTAVLQKIVQVHKGRYPNFQMHFLEFNHHEVLKKWLDSGREAWEMMDAIDSFHTSQDFQAFSAEHIWNQTLASFPQALGPVNPHNDRIVQLFGQQGGH